MPESTQIAIPKRAVFVSYASQDATAARRICESLRAAGAQVWLDESELAGGDAWDSKIRGQIEACALFVAIISAHTNARMEGYFRREWKLAVERTHGMHQGLAFLMPVIIDTTSDAEALVPDKFREVQWTKLPGGQVPPAFSERVTRLLNGAPDGTVPLHRSTPPTGQVVSGPPRAVQRIGVAWASAIAAVVAIAVVSCLVFWPKAPTVMPVQRSEPQAVVPAPAILEKSIAILPFVNMSEDKGNAYFADGVQEDILTNLATIGDMNVVSRTSVMAYRDTTKPTQQIARELGVAYVLEGSVRKEGKTVRVTGQLIDGRTGLHVWARSYDRELDDIFAIQSALSKEIADALHAQLTPQDLARLEAKPTDNAEAYDLFLRGKAAYFSNGTPTEWKTEALRLFEQAVALDPKFANAWLEIEWVYSSMYDDNPKAEFKAKQAAAMEAAEGLAPDSLGVLLRLFNEARGGADNVKADALLKRLAKAYPNNADVVLAQAQFAADSWNTRLAATYFAKALALDPGNSADLTLLGMFDMSVRKFDEASIAFSFAENQGAHWKWGMFRIALQPYFARGDAAPAEAFVSKLTPEDLRSDANSISASAVWSYMRGDAAAVVRLWESSGSHFVFVPFSDRNILYPVAECLLVLGQPERAAPILRKYRDEAEAVLVRNPDDEAALTDLMNMSYRLHENAAARSARDRLLKVHPEDADDVISQAAPWSGEPADRDAAIARLGVILREPTNDAWRYNVHCMEHAVHMWPLQGDPRFEALINDPANNAPKL
jgi:TolB-like protein/tetratricopeptide (TPR) repeat protein